MQQLLLFLLAVFILVQPLTDKAKSMHAESFFSMQNLQLPPDYNQRPDSVSIIKIYIVNLRSRGGQLCIAVFDNDKNFRNEKPLKVKNLNIRPEEENTLTVELELPAGNYGISILDDTDSDGRMKYGFAGIPLEGFGFSGYRQKGLKRPRFSDFSFRHDGEKVTCTTVHMTYML